MASGRSSPSPQQASKDKALIILSSHSGLDAASAQGGVSATSFIETYVNLSSTSLNIVLATPNAAAPVFSIEDEKAQYWIKSKAHLFTNMKSLAEIHESEFSIVVIPHGLGASQDLLLPDYPCSRFLSAYLALNRPICAIGFGVFALLGTVKASKGVKKSGVFGRCITATSNAEVSRFDYFKSLTNNQLEDLIREKGGKYSCAEIDSPHIVVDGALVTAQNMQSSSLALQNAIWLWKAAQTARMNKSEY